MVFQKIQKARDQFFIFYRNDIVDIVLYVREYLFPRRLNSRTVGDGIYMFAGYNFSGLQ